MHKFRPVIAVTLAFAFGIMISVDLRIFIGIFLCLVALSILLLYSFYQRENVVLISVVIGFISLGVLWTQSSQMKPVNHYENLLVKEEYENARMMGVIITDVKLTQEDNFKKTSFRLKVTACYVQGKWKPAQGKMLVQIFRVIPLSYGDRIVVEGKIHSPFGFSSRGKFSYREFLKRQGIEHILSVKKDGEVDRYKMSPPNFFRKFALETNHRFQNILESHLSYRELGMMEALLLGNRQHFDSRLQELFIFSGTAHVLAISGLHVVVVAFLFMVFCKMLPFPRWTQYLTASFLLVFYSMVTGEQPSVVRATIMSIVFLLSYCVERETDGLNTLALAALIIFLFDPLNLWDVGFQLSFVSVFAIIIYSQWEQKMLEGKSFLERYDWLKSLINSLGISLAASLATGGIVAYCFHLITPIGLLANLIVVPLSTGAIILGTGVLMMGIFSPFLASLFAFCLKILVNLMAAVSAFFIHWPHAYFILDQVSWVSVMIYYGFLVSIYVLKPVAK
ncbi:MAG: ComEC family competence protein [Candidatus Omnitrophica bacterium]|nr:ComEC family competence protein [Candidatus Omnitrophota bacterium]